MTNYEKLCQMTPGEMASFFVKHFDLVMGPWDDWFDKTYCQNCSPITKEDHEYAPCEILPRNNSRCLCAGLIPDRTSESHIAFWLNSEAEE